MPGSRGSVLIVNDQLPVRDAVMKLLQQRGFRTRAADTGRKALEFARSDRPDVILIDMDPPLGGRLGIGPPPQGRPR